jgi:hypothetical protein
VRGSSVGDGRCARLEALEVRFDLLFDGSGADELADAVRAAWDWCLVAPERASAQAADERLTLVLDPDLEVPPPGETSGSLVARDLPSLMDRLSPLITRRAVSRRKDDLVMFHACAVADPSTGEAVILYGPSGAGKTTLARTLCADLVYLSDETAGVTADGQVVPYAKPLSIIVRPGDELKKQVSPGALGLLPPGDRSFRLGGLVQLRRDPEHRGKAVLEHLATVEALPELVAQTSYTSSIERPLHRLASLAHEVDGVRRVTYAEAEQLRPLVRALLDGEA